MRILPGWCESDKERALDAIKRLIYSEKEADKRVWKTLKPHWVLEGDNGFVVTDRNPNPPTPEGEEQEPLVPIVYHGCPIR